MKPKNRTIFVIAAVFVCIFIISSYNIVRVYAKKSCVVDISSPMIVKNKVIIKYEDSEHSNKEIQVQLDDNLMSVRSSFALDKVVPKGILDVYKMPKSAIRNIRLLERSENGRNSNLYTMIVCLFGAVGWMVTDISSGLRFFISHLL